MFAALIAATLATAATPVLAQSLVVRASGPSARTYPAGAKLAQTASLSLKAGDVVTLLDGRGTRTLRGPGTFAANGPVAAGTDDRNTLSSILETKRVRRARTGAVRGPGETVPQRSPSLWYVDVSQPSTMCVADPANLRLWRPASVKAASITATPATGGTAANIAFPVGEATAAWPAELPVKDGTSYKLSWTGLAQPVTIRFTVMDATAEGLEEMAATLIARKCQAQLDLLVETVALPDAGPATPVG
jgi:hypothetical protein